MLGPLPQHGCLPAAGDCCVWSLLALPDGTMVTGDSRGFVSFWDAVHGTAVAQFRRHAADVLALAASPDGRSVYAAGVDPQVVLYSRAAGAEEGAWLCRTTWF